MTMFVGWEDRPQFDGMTMIILVERVSHGLHFIAFSFVLVCGGKGMLDN